MIQVEHLRKTYDRRVKNPAPALHDVSFTLPDTGLVCIVGPSGCGKTTLLNAMGGLDRFDGGAIRTDGLKSLRCGSRLTEAERNRSFGYVFQSYYLLPQHSALYNVYLGLHSLALSHREKLKRSLEALRAVDMERFARREVGALSGGQQQRVAIARALARRPRVIFADEPTGNLDEANTMNICALLRRISRTSLVVMVTHEERIARFFADRIITLEAGRLVSDSRDWRRGDLAAGQGLMDSTLYTGEFLEETVEAQGLTLRLLREAEAEPVALTVAVQRGRVVVKLDDSRVTAFGRSQQTPVLQEGPRPILKLEELDQGSLDLSWAESAPQAKAGSSLGAGLLLREAGRLLHSEKLQRLISTLFLAVLTVLALLTVGDYLKVSSIDPEDFVTTDSHILELNFERGAGASSDPSALKNAVREFNGLLETSGLEYQPMPQVLSLPSYSTSVFIQMGSVKVNLGNFSYVPLSSLDPSTLIYGRMPERSDEVVIDRWVLEAMMARDGILQAGISDTSYFLGERFTYLQKDYSPTLVGISDCGEPAFFLSDDAIISIGTRGVEVITLSSLRGQFPGKYDHLSLEPGQCIMVTNNAGAIYTEQAGNPYRTNAGASFTIAGSIREPGTYASIVVREDALPGILAPMMETERYFLYCKDKEAVKALLSQPLSASLADTLRVSVTDANADAWTAYRAATQFRMDGRRVVTFTVMALSLAMLYLLQRSRVQERAGMIAVYRLLGIPGRKLSVIFVLECFLLTLSSVLPAGALTWLVVAVITALPDLEISILLPWSAAALTCLAILASQLLASLLPLWRLLRLPPARLAAMYDF